MIYITIMNIPIYAMNVGIMTVILNVHHQGICVGGGVHMSVISLLII